MANVEGMHRYDKYFCLAKERGFRSRASYKLLQLDDKYSLLHSAHAVIDLCAAPGSWMQVAVEKVPVGSLVLGIDLVPIVPVGGCVAIQQDISRTECKSMIKQVMEQHGVRAFDLVLHDGSPNVGGAWPQEAMSQNALVIDSVRLATEFLAPNGNLITKVFRSRDFNNVLCCLGRLFDKVEVCKPRASRTTTAETYLLGLKYKAPAKIDPRLLDYRHLFKEEAEPTQKLVDVLGDEENDDDKLLNELEELTNTVDLKKKQAKKVLSKRLRYDPKFKKTHKKKRGRKASPKESIGSNHSRAEQSDLCL